MPGIAQPGPSDCLCCSPSPPPPPLIVGYIDEDSVLYVDENNVVYVDEVPT